MAELFKPYISKIYNKKTGEKFTCIIQNISKNYVSFIDLNIVKKSELPLLFNMADKWWNVNNTIPLCIHYRDDFDRFDYAKKVAISNDMILEDGWEGIRLKQISEKRIKRKIINILPQPEWV